MTRLDGCPAFFVFSFPIFGLFVWRGCFKKQKTDQEGRSKGKIKTLFELGVDNDDDDHQPLLPLQTKPWGKSFEKRDYSVWELKLIISNYISKISLFSLNFFFFHLYWILIDSLIFSFHLIFIETKKTIGRCPRIPYNSAIAEAIRGKIRVWSAKVCSCVFINKTQNELNLVASRLSVPVA